MIGPEIFGTVKDRGLCQLADINASIGRTDIDSPAIIARAPAACALFSALAVFKKCTSASTTPDLAIDT